METILVSVEETNTNGDRMQAAIEQVETMGGSLVVLHVMSEGRYEARQRAIAGSSTLRADGMHYTIYQARAAAEAIATRAAIDAIGHRDIEYVALGEVGNESQVVLDVAEDYGCTTVILNEPTGWRRYLGGSGGTRLDGFTGSLRRIPNSSPAPFPMEPSRA